VQHREEEGQLLPHTAGEAAGEPAAGAGEPCACEELRGALVTGAPSEPVGGGDELDVFVHAEVVVDARCAGHIADAAAVRAQDPSARRTDHASERAQQRRLAGAVPADHGGHLSGSQLERDVLQRRAPAVAHGQVADTPRGESRGDVAHAAPPAGV
jgi:hypothetical protein